MKKNKKILIKNNVMSKTNKFLTLLFVTLLTITSCVQDDDYTIPQSLGEEESKNVKAILAQIETGQLSLLSIAEVKNLYQNNLPEQVDTDIVVKGYVTSSDQTGNFFREIYLQDAPENPTAGIKIIINQIDSYNQYNLGREVYIKLKGLYVGEERVGNEIITIGGATETDQFGTTVTRLTENQRASSMFRSEISMPLVGKKLAFSQVTSNTIGLYVTFENVEFEDNLNGLRYFDPIQDFDTQRRLQSCSGFNYSNFIIETSSFSTFKNELLPTGNGTISGVITKDFTGSTLLMALNTTADVNFTNSRCSLLDASNFSPLLSENFEAQPINTDINISGWTNFAQAGTRVWRTIVTTDSGNSGSKIASMGAFNSNQPSNIAWLISPSINLDAQNFEFLNFRTSNSFSDGSELEVLISTNWNGSTATITTATWTPLPATIVSDSEFFQNWIDSGLIDLSSYSGTAYIAFKYIGGDNAANTIDGNFELDDFKVLVEN